MSYIIYITHLLAHFSFLLHFTLVIYGHIFILEGVKIRSNGLICQTQVTNKLGLVCEMSIPLGKGIGIMGNRRGWNGIIIPIL